MHFLIIITFAFCTTRALAQSCDETFDIRGPLNASALVEVPSSGTPPWYLSVTFSDERNTATPDQSIYGFLSTPANSTAHACTRRFEILLPATGTGSNGDCAGVLSDTCIDLLTENLAMTQSDVGNKSCPDRSTANEIEKACPPLGDTFGKTFIAGQFLVSNTACPSSRLPGAQQPPPDYDNISLLGGSFDNDESDRLDSSQFKWYDKYIQQPMLWVVSAFEDGESRTSLVCVRPERVERGSRVPSTDTSGTGKLEVGWGTVAIMAAAAVLLVG